MATMQQLRRILSRRETEVVRSADSTWALQEEALAYGQETGLKDACKAIK